MRYIKLFEEFQMINEGVMRLTPDEQKQFNKLFIKLRGIIQLGDFSKADKTIKGPQAGPGGEEKDITIKAIEVGDFKYQMADGKDASLKIYVGDWKQPSIENRTTPPPNGFYRYNDRNDLHDNYIFINYDAFKVEDDKEDMYKNIPYAQHDVGPVWEEQYNELLRSILFHEIMHAKDPNYNHKLLDQSKQIGKDYFARDEEVKAFTAQFVNLIENRVDMFIEEYKNKLTDPTLQKKIAMLGQLLESFIWIFKKGWIMKGEYQYNLNMDLVDFIEKFQLNVKNLDKVWGKSGNEEDEEFYRTNVDRENKIASKGSKFLTNVFSALKTIRQKEPKKFKKFLGTIYTTIMNSVDKVNKMIEGTKLKPIVFKGESNVRW